MARKTDDFFYSSLKSANNLKTEQCLLKASCDVCSSGSVANFCGQCKQWICEGCSRIHKNFTTTSTHTLTPAAKKAKDVFARISAAVEDTKRLNERREQQQRVETSLEQLTEVYETCRKELDAEFERKRKEIRSQFPRYDESRVALETIASELQQLNIAVDSDEKMSQKLQKLSDTSSELHKITKTELSTWNNGSDGPAPTIQRNRYWTARFAFVKENQAPAGPRDKR